MSCVSSLVLQTRPGLPGQTCVGAGTADDAHEVGPAEAWPAKHSRRCGWRCHSQPVNGSCRLVPARPPALGGCGAPPGGIGVPSRRVLPAAGPDAILWPLARASSGITLGSMGPVTPVGVTLLCRVLDVPRTARRVSCVLPVNSVTGSWLLSGHVTRGQVHWASCRRARDSSAARPFQKCRLCFHRWVRVTGMHDQARAGPGHRSPRPALSTPRSGLHQGPWRQVPSGARQGGGRGGRCGGGCKAPEPGGWGVLPTDSDLWL